MTPPGHAEREQTVRGWYKAERYRCLVFLPKLVDRLQGLLKEQGVDKPTIESRVKEVDSYVAKALKPDPVDPTQFKYLSPQQEIADAIGIRIIVPLSSDLAPVLKTLNDGFQVDEQLERGNEPDANVPGYQSTHMLIRLAADDLLESELAEFHDLVAEVQIRSILQHAWAALQHDLNYKTERPPSASIRRRLTSLAGLLDLADREFISVRREQADPTAPTSGDKIRGGILSAASLRVLVEEVVGETDSVDHVWFLRLLSTMGELGLSRVEDVSSALGSMRDEGPRLEVAMKTRRPWVNPAVVFDELLRLALGDAYFDRRAARLGLTNVDDAKAAFMRDLAQRRDELSSVT